MPIVMSKKQTVLDKASDAVQELADDALQAGQQLGVVAMTTAAVISMVAHDESKKVIVPSQPVVAFAEDSNSSNISNQIRREKEGEDAGPQYISYSVAQRTPARSGKH